MQFFNRERKKRITILLIGTVLLVMCKVDLAHPGVDGFLKQRSQTATPGYINAAKQKTQNIINQTPRENGFFKGLVEHLKDIAFLQIEELLELHLTEEEFKRLPPKEVDNIIDKLENIESKSDTVKRILRKKDEYKKKHIVSARIFFKEKTELLLRDFIYKIKSILERKRVGGRNLDKKEI
tara:strand:- start:431 stop:973 length:543 start_codon:yes stop_codon:yes gene_type:complete